MWHRRSLGIVARASRPSHDSADTARYFKFCPLALVWLSAILAVPGLAAAPAGTDMRPPLLRDVSIEQKLRSQLPLEVRFRDEDGRQVALGAYFGTKPVILSFAYNDCPMLCSLILDGLTRGLRAMPLNMGDQYEAVNISIDPRELPSAANRKKQIYVRQYGREGAAAGWHFLTGDEASIRKVADAAGFRYAYDPASRQYAHTSGIMIATPQGRLSRYFYGIVFSPRDLRLGLVEAASEKIGTPVDRLLLFCYHYDEATGKYTLLISRIVKLAGFATVLVLGSVLFILFMRDRRVRRDA